jgi:hypothetical protein
LGRGWRCADCLNDRKDNSCACGTGTEFLEQLTASEVFRGRDVQHNKVGIGQLIEGQPDSIVGSGSEARGVERLSHRVDIVLAIAELEHERCAAVESACLVAVGVEDEQLVVDLLDC